MSLTDDFKENPAKFILNRERQLAKVREPYLPLWKDIIDFVDPRLYNLDSTKVEGMKVGQYMFDGTPISALNLLADGLHGYLVSPSMRWFKLKLAGVGSLEDLLEVRQWLENVEEVMFSAFQRSNFYETMSSFFRDGGSIGTAHLYSEEDIRSNRIVFSVRHPGEMCIAQNFFGRVDTEYRKCQFTLRQLVTMFGKAVPAQMSLRAATSPEEKQWVIHAVFPNEDRDVMKIDSGNLPFSSYYVLEKGDTGPVVLSKSGYRSNPYASWRWKVLSNEIYGRSPASDALVDIISLHQIGRSLLKAAHLSVEPPLNVPSEMRGKVRINPSGINYYEDAGRFISPVNLGINFPIGEDREARKIKIIEEHFKVDFFIMLARSERMMTATEIMERQGEKAAVLGPTIGRLNSEALDPIIDRVFDIELEAGRLPAPPDIVVEKFAGHPIEVDYMGPLAQAQKRLFKVQGVTNTIESIKPLLEIDASILDNFDLDEIARQVAEANGLITRAIRPMDVVLAIRQSREEAIKAEKMAAMLAATSQAIPNLSQTPGKGSPIDQMQGAMEGGAMEGGRVA